jgi:hypothetical protein
MPALLKIANPIRFQKLTRVMLIRGVDTYVHGRTRLTGCFSVRSEKFKSFTTKDTKESQRITKKSPV